MGCEGTEKKSFICKLYANKKELQNFTYVTL